MIMAEPSRVKEHHKQQDVAANRPSYREARWERAVKVYTVNKESKYLLVINVPALGVVKDLVELFAIYGEINQYRLLDEYPCEEYTDVYFIQYKDINDARMAKKKLDNHSFFGNQLHICYAPEYESVEETREKLEERKRAVAMKLHNAQPVYYHHSEVPRGSQLLPGQLSPTQPALTTMVPTVLPPPLPLPPTHPRMVPCYPSGVPQRMIATPSFVSIYRPPPLAHSCPPHPHPITLPPPPPPHPPMPPPPNLLPRAIRPKSPPSHAVRHKPIPSPPPLITQVWPHARAHSSLSPRNEEATFLSSPVTKPSPPPLITNSPATPTLGTSQHSNKPMVATQQLTPNLRPSTITRVPVVPSRPVICNHQTHPISCQPHSIICQTGTRPPVLVSTPQLHTSSIPTLCHSNTTTATYTGDTVSTIKSKMNQIFREPPPYDLPQAKKRKRI